MLGLLPTLCSHTFAADTSKCEIRNKGAYEDYIFRLNTILHQLIFNGRGKTKLAMLAFLYCGEIVKNSNACSLDTLYSKILFLDEYSKERVEIHSCKPY